MRCYLLLSEDNPNQSSKEYNDETNSDLAQRYCLGDFEFEKHHDDKESENQERIQIRS